MTELEGFYLELNTVYYLAPLGRIHILLGIILVSLVKNNNKEIKNGYFWIAESNSKFPKSNLYPEKKNVYLYYNVTFTHYLTTVYLLFVDAVFSFFLAKSERPSTFVDKKTKGIDKKRISSIVLVEQLECKVFSVLFYFAFVIILI